MQINIFKTENKFKKFKKENFEANFNLYWKIIILFVFLAILGSFAFGYYLFTETSKEFSLFDEVNNSKKIDIEKKQRTEKILDMFKERENKSYEILNSPAPVIDPSV